MVAHLPDSAEDVEIVLQALVERGFTASRNPVPVKVVAAFLRLGQKYDFEAFISKLSIGSSKVPTTLEDYDTLKTGSQIQDNPGGLGFWFNMLTIAHDINLQSVLPFALYMCYAMGTIYGLSTLSQGIDRPDGSTAQLSIDDQIKCLSSYQTLSHNQNTTTFAWLDVEDAYESYDNVTHCGPHCNYLLREFFFNNSTARGLDKWENGLLRAENRSTCVPCDAIANEIHTTGRLFFWKMLPEAFELPTWEELREERAECLKAK